MNKKKKAELEAFKKAHEERKAKEKERLELQKKLFPNGVLKGDPSAPKGILLNELEFMRMQRDLSDSISKEIAERNQVLEENENKRLDSSHKSKFENNLARFKALLLREDITIGPNSKATQIEKILIEKGVDDIPDTKSIRVYIEVIKKGS